MKKFQGEKVRELRKLRGFTVRELAKLVKVSPTYISKIENNKVNPSVPVLEAIALALNAEPGYFFKDESSLTRSETTELISSPSSQLTSEGNNKTDPLTDLLKRFEKRNPDTLTVEEALDLVLRSDHVMFDGKPVGEMDEDILLDIRDTVVAILKYKANLKKAVVGMKGVANNCLAAAAGAG